MTKLDFYYSEAMIKYQLAKDSGELHHMVAAKKLLEKYLELAAKYSEIETLMKEVA